LVIGKVDPNPGAIPDVLKSFLTDSIWSACKALEAIPLFNGFCGSLETEYLLGKNGTKKKKQNSPIYQKLTKM